MKKFFLLCSASSVLLVGYGCATRHQDSPARVIATPAASAASSGLATYPGIPARPENLTYPPISYEPPDPKEYRVQLKGGPIAYVVPDRELPLINIAIYVRCGSYLEPEGKIGVSDRTGYLLARGGTKSRKAEELEERLAFLAANLSSGVGADQGNVSLNLLSKDVDEGLVILREVLTTPRFQDDRLSLRRQQLLQNMKQRNDESAAIEGRERGFLAFGDAFFANRYSTEASINGLTREDLEAFHQRWFHPANFVVAASGDFDRQAMIQKLESLFAGWPYSGEMAPSVPTNTMMASPGAYLVNKDVNQGRVAMMLPGMLRSDPDYFPGVVMNDILGGGGFTARIVNRVRSDEGLAYSAGSSLPGGVYYPLTFTASYQSKSRTVAFAAQIVIEELGKMTAAPVTEVELGTTKQGFIERFPRSFGSKAQVAATFAQDEYTGRFKQDPDYWKNYRSKLEAVTKDDIQRVARRLLHPEKMVILVVGQRDEILKGHPDHPMKLTELTNGKLTDVPLRDPLTMKPITN